MQVSARPSDLQGCGPSLSLVAISDGVVRVPTDDRGYAISAWGLGTTFFASAGAMALIVIAMATLTRVSQID